MKKFLLKSLLAFGAITVPLAGTAMALTSCTTTSTTDYSTTAAARYWSDFLNENHGRWTGNVSNFDNVKSDNSGFETTTTRANPELSPKYTLETTVRNTKVNNYGSYHAYQWLLNKAIGLGYVNQTSTVNRPAYGTVTTATGQAYRTITATSGTTKTVISEPRVSSSGTLTRGERSVIYNEPSSTDAAALYKTGIVTQGFLWNGNDRGNGLAETFNNVGSNLIVTINPDESIENTTEPYDFWIVSHYDSTAKTGTGQAQASWGATDNATSVAVNLALLEYFSKIENRANLKSRLHIVFADAEEVGVLGSNALVRQYLDASGTAANYPLLASSWGMINMDTVAGGDFMYVHSSSAGTGNKSTEIRDMINTISKSIASQKNDSEYELQLHKQYHYQGSEQYEEDFAEGETGDWSDHAPFYQTAKLPVAYFESTNFALQSKTDVGAENGLGVFDGYSQTTNKYAWLTYDYVPVEMKKTVDDSGQTIWTLPDGYKLSDFLIGGDIWHSDIDTPSWLAEYIGLNKIYKQLDVCFQSLVEFLTTTTPKKITS